MNTYIRVQTEEAVGGAAPIIYRARSLSELLSLVRDIDELVGTEMMHTPISHLSVLSEEDALSTLLRDEEAQIFVRDADQRPCWLQTDGTTIPVQP